MKFKHAFTLSEVLIVIAIIGIVATLTITNISNDYDEDELVTRVKIAYNDFELAYQKAINQYGPYETWNSSLSNEEKAKRILDFIKGNYCTGAECLSSDIISIYGNQFFKKEAENGSVMVVRPPLASSQHFEFYVVPYGRNSGVYPGKDLFEFYTIDNNQTVVPMGYGNDRDSDDNLAMVLPDDEPDELYQATNWVVHIGNLDYNKCDDLNWETKTTCD